MSVILTLIGIGFLALGIFLLESSEEISNWQDDFWQPSINALSASGNWAGIVTLFIGIILTILGVLNILHIIHL